MSRAQAPVGGPAALERGRFRLVFGGVLVSLLVASLDQTIVGTALPAVTADLGGLAHLSWIVTAYLVATTACTPLWGRLGDLHGHKKMLISALVVFLVGSAACGLAWDMTSLVLFRGLQGVGAGGLVVMAMALIGLLVPARERGRYQGYIQAVFTVATVAGPVVGGALAEHLSWRWIFFVNLPLGVAAIAVLRLIPDGVRPANGRGALDYRGAAALVAGIGGLLLVAALGGREFAWTSWQLVVVAAVSVALLALFVRWERGHSDPLLDPAVLTDPVVRVASVALFATTCCFFAVMVFLPVRLQIVLDVELTEAGLLLLPMLLAIVLSNTLSGRAMTKTGRYKVFPVVGTALVAAATAALGFLDSAAGVVGTVAVSVVLGVGFGMVSQVLVVAVQNAVPRNRLGVATAAATFFRSLGGALGAALFGALFAAHATGLADFGSIDQIDARSASGVADGVRWVFRAALPVALVGFAAVLVLKEIPLRGRGGTKEG